MHQSPLLIAAGVDWLEGLAGSVVVIIWVISQVIKVLRAAGGRTAAPPPPAPERRPPTRSRPRGATDAQAEMERQIEAFLRDRRGDAASATRPPPPLPRPVPARSAAAAQRAATATEISGSDVSRHVADAFAHQLDHLSSGLAEAPARPETRPQPAGAGAELTAALRSPATLRRLFLLREVLDRPTERW